MPRAQGAGDRRRRRLQAACVYLVLTVGDDRETWSGPLRAALASGAVDVLQLRDRRGRREDTGRAATALRELCHEHGVLLLLNDHPDWAAAWDLDGAHVGQDDMAPDAARAHLGAERILGLSTHDADEVRAARLTAVDYAGLGPCFPSDSKQLVRPPGGAALVAEGVAAAGDLPLFPIGGITPANVALLARAGARRAAVGAGILAASQPAAAARSLRDLLAGA